MAKIRFTAELLSATTVGASITVGTEFFGDKFVIKSFMPQMMVGLLHGMRDANEDAFYKAMAKFADEDMDNATEWIRGHLND